MHTQTTEILYNYSFIFKQAIGLQINDTTLRFYDYCEHYQSISRTNEVSHFQRVGVHDITLHHHGITILKTLIMMIILITDVTLKENFLFTTRMHLNLPVTYTPQIYLLIPFPPKSSLSLIFHIIITPLGRECVHEPPTTFSASSTSLKAVTVKPFI